MYVVFTTGSAPKTGTDATLLTTKLGPKVTVVPLIVPTTANRSNLRLAGSSRLSYQAIDRAEPSGLTAIAGKAWTFVVASVFIRWLALHVKPPSVDLLKKTSLSLPPTAVTSGWTAKRRAALTGLAANWAN